MGISEYQFERLICNNASEKDIAKLFNISLEEATYMVKNDLKSIYDGIEKVYNTSENIDIIISEFREIEEAKEIDKENYSQDNFYIFGYYDIEKNKFYAGIKYEDETWTIYDSFSSIDDVKESDILDVLYEIREKEIRKAIA